VIFFELGEQSTSQKKKKSLWQLVVNNS